MLGAYQAEGIHIERRLLFALLVVFIFSTMLQSSLIPLASVQIENADSDFLSRQCIQSKADTAIELTWTSRWESYPQAVLNDSELVGDHVVLNATFLGQVGFVEPYEMTMNITGINTTISSPNSSIVYDTYPSKHNFTTSVSIRIENGVNETIISTFSNLSISNFFCPTLSPVMVEELESDYYSISWSSEDRNADDSNFHILWISNDGGEAYNLLAKNLTYGQYFWNSSGWLDGSYIFRVRAFSVDLLYFGGPFLDIPADYWPGDYSDGYSSSFQHTDVVPPGLADVSVTPASDLTYYLGSISNTIEWRLAFHFSDSLSDSIPVSVAYTVTHNGMSYINGNQSIGADYENTYIIVQIDGLGLGVHNFTLLFANPGDNGGVVSDSVLVTVQSSDELFMSAVYIIGGVGIGALFIATAALIIRSRSRQI